MLSHISTELVLQVYDNLNHSDILSLSLVCKRFANILPASRKLSTHFEAAEREFGPLTDAIQVVALQTHAPHIDQTPSLSFPLLRSLIRMGKIATKFEEIYPILKWRHNFLDRRSLSTVERYLLRRAVYRSWRYAAAFHTPTFPRTTRLLCSASEMRKSLLRFPTHELLELEDMRRIFEQVITTFIIPIHLQDIYFEKDRTHFPGGRPSPVDTLFHSFGVTTHEEHKSFLGWGDEIAQYYLVQDLLKLDPGQMMWLKENSSFAEIFIQGLGDWFHNNGETLSQTLTSVLLARGEEDLLEGLENGELGIAKNRPNVFSISIGL